MPRFTMVFAAFISAWNTQQIVITAVAQGAHYYVYVCLHLHWTLYWLPPSSKVTIEGQEEVEGVELELVDDESFDVVLDVVLDALEPLELLLETVPELMLEVMLGVVV